MSNCLVKWQGFDAYRNEYIKHETEFVNVTLACEDGQDIKAHKVILSSGSLFFRDVLSKIRHPEPLLFLYGLKRSDLQNIIEFIYTGRTSIVENEIGKFIQIAKLFKIPGLENFECISAAKDAIVDKEPEIAEEAKSPQSYQFDDELVDLKDEDSQEDLDFCRENISIIDNEESEVNSGEITTQFIEENGNDNNDKIIREDLIDKMDGWECKECKKTFLRQDHFKCHLKTHSKHKENVCTFCNKTLRTKSALRNHISYVHSKTSAMCSGCGKSGMNKNQLRNHTYQAKLTGKCPKERSNVKIDV